MSQTTALAGDGIPVTALHAYQHAAQMERRRASRCGLSWPLLAAIGRVESDHGRFAGAVLHNDGVSTPRIIGIPLNGRGTARIPDTDYGRLDGDPIYDRAVGPMQFIPATWARYGLDGNHDHRVDPFNIFDAAVTTADYLCAASGGALTTLAGQIQAVLTSNHSDAYLALVLQIERLYARGVPGLTIPTLPAGTTQHLAPRPGIPVANPGAAVAEPHPPVAGQSPITRTPTTVFTLRPIRSTPAHTPAATTCPSPSSTSPPSTSTPASTTTAPTAPPASSTTSSSGQPRTTAPHSPASTTSRPRC